MQPDPNQRASRLSVDALIPLLLELDNMVLHVDAAGIICEAHANPGEHLFDRPVDALIGLDVASVVPAAAAERIKQTCTEARSAGQAQATLEADRDQRYALRAFAVEPAEHERVLLALRPLSTLASQPTMLRRAWESAPGLVLYIDDDNRYVGYAGRAELLAAPPAALLGQRVEDIVPGEFAHPFRANAERARQTGNIVSGEYNLEIAGQIRPFAAHLQHRDGMLLAFIRDLSDQEIHRQRLGHEGWFQKLADVASDMIVVLDVAESILYINAAGLKLLDYPWGLPPGFTTLDLVHGNSHGRVREHLLRRRRRDFTHFVYEVDLCRRDGSPIPVEVSSKMVELGERAPVILVLARDISARRKTQDALRRAHQRNQLLLNNTMEGVAMTTVAGHIKEVNPAFCTLVGLSAAQLIDRNIIHMLHDDLNEVFAADDLRRADGAPARLESTLVDSSGAQIDVELTVYLIDVGSDPRLYVTMRDVTAERTAQRWLQQVALRWQVLYEIDNSIIAAQTFTEVVQVVLQQLTAVVECDFAAVVVFDYASELKRHFILRTATWEIDASMTTPLDTFVDLDTLRQGRTHYIEDMNAHLADDTVEMTATAREMAARFGIMCLVAVPVLYRDELVATLGIGTYAKTHAFNEEDVSITRNVAASLAVAYEQTSLRQQLQEYARDLEDKVQARTAELARLNERLRELDEMKSMFISDVSHELRTPVNNLSMRLRLLEMDSPASMPMHRELLKVQIDHLSQLVEDILQLSRIDLGRATVSFRMVDINRVIEPVIEAHRPRALLKNVQLLFEPLPVPLLLGEPNQLSQVVTNVVANALNYTPSGMVRVLTQRNDDKGVVQVIVEDTGMGVEDVDKPHIFERFYRGRTVAKSDIPGTGLGLGIVAEIVGIHGGRIFVEDNEPQGARFVVELPLIEALRRQSGYNDLQSS